MTKKKDPEDLLPAGRPTKYSPEFLLKIEQMGKNGESVAEVIEILEISKDTFYRWQEEHPEFSDAIKAYRIRHQAWWERNGRDGVFGKIPGFSASGYSLQMRNRFPEDWRERHELTGKDGEPVITQVAHVIIDPKNPTD